MNRIIRPIRLIRIPLLLCSFVFINAKGFMQTVSISSLASIGGNGISGQGQVYETIDDYSIVLSAPTPNFVYGGSGYANAGVVASQGSLHLHAATQIMNGTSNISSRNIARATIVDVVSILSSPHYGTTGLATFQFSIPGFITASAVDAGPTSLASTSFYFSVYGDRRVSFMESSHSIDFDLYAAGSAAPFFSSNIPQDRIVSIVLPFRFGTSFDVGLYTETVAEISINAVGEWLHAISDYDNSIYWNGITSVTDLSGNLIDGWSVQSGLGIDYLKSYGPSSVETSPVPEPSTYGLIAAATLLALAARRRIQAART